jgi:hypothetical protein
MKTWWWHLRAALWRWMARVGLRYLDGMGGLVWLLDAMFWAVEDAKERANDDFVRGRLKGPLARMLPHEYEALRQILARVFAEYKGDGVAVWWMDTQAAENAKEQK